MKTMIQQILEERKRKEREALLLRVHRIAQAAAEEKPGTPVTVVIEGVSVTISVGPKKR